MLDWLTYTVLAFAGAAAGFIDAIAGGGGLISVPALLWAGLPVPVALGTNKLQSSCGTTLAVIHYTRNGLIPWHELRGAVAITFVAAVLGVRAVTHMDRELLEKLVPILLVVVAVYTAANPRLGAIHRKPAIGRTAFAFIFGSALGFYDGFFGPGTGSFWMLACVLALGLNLRDATGTTKALNLASNLAALSAFAFDGLLRWDAGLAMIAGQLVGARIGSGLVVRNGAKIIRPVFIATALALALRLAWKAFAP
ncbi:MAG: hypothetical protein RL088_1475 [Verrucomicrobiota bacterium]|jgi:uncharacterized membrane protein YfcA